MARVYPSSPQVAGNLEHCRQQVGRADIVLSERNQRHNLDFDIEAQGRYNHRTVQLRAKAESMNRSANGSTRLYVSVRFRLMSLAGLGIDQTHCNHELKLISCTLDDNSQAFIMAEPKTWMLERTYSTVCLLRSATSVVLDIDIPLLVMSQISCLFDDGGAFV